MITLTIEKRDTQANLDGLRKGGKLPGVFYGPKEEATPILLDTKAFLKVWHEAGESSVIGLEGIGETKDVLIHDVDVHPVTQVPRHVDFYVIEKGKKVTVNVPLVFAGVSPAVKNLGANLIKVLHEIEIEAMPKDLPHEIVIDISNLAEIGSHISVGDIQLPSGVVALADKEDMIVSVAAVEEEKEQDTTPIDMSAIEVEKKGKKEEEKTPDTTNE